MGLSASGFPSAAPNNIAPHIIVQVFAIPTVHSALQKEMVLWTVFRFMHANVSRISFKAVLP